MSGKLLAREHEVAPRGRRPASAMRSPTLLTSWHFSGHRVACRLRAAPRILRPHTFQHEEEVRR